MWCLLLWKGLLPGFEMFHMLPLVMSHVPISCCLLSLIAPLLLQGHLALGFLRRCQFMAGFCKDCIFYCVAW